MSTRKMLETFVKDRTSSADHFPEIVKEGIQTVGGEIPANLKLAITLSELISFVSNLRIPIKLYDGTLVPVNAIVFALSASGTSKDKSLSAVRKALQGAYNIIEEERVDMAREAAYAKAEAAGQSDDWQQFYKKPKPLQSGLGTVEGLLHHFSDIASNPIGAGSIMSSEIGSELQTNAHMPEIIKTISVAYDLGNVPAKVVKSSENQTEALRGFPVNALFFGSQEGILFNNDIKGKFKLAFNTQLARRSIFTYSPEEIPRLEFSTIEELYKYREEERERVLKAQEVVSEKALSMLERKSREPLELSKEASMLFDVYLEYNVIRSEEVSNKYPISKISQKHKQWLALKLSGAYALLDGSESIEEFHYATAINTVEFLSKDLENFEKELIKEPYEQLVHLCKHNQEEGQYFISIHELKKLSYLKGTGASKPKMEELVLMANSYDETGNYESVSDGIQYKQVLKTDVVGVSYLVYDTHLRDDKFKEYAADKCFKGFEFYETAFEELSLLLQENAVYTPFRFKGGVRHKDNVEGGAKFLVLDVDKSFLTKEEAHILLNGYNHHISVTSDPENDYKFRVLLEFDSPVDVDDVTWKALLAVVGEELGFSVDLLPKSQIFFSFMGREVLTQLEGSTLPSKELIDKARARVKSSSKPVSSLPAKERQQKLLTPRETFAFAFDAEKGERSIKMYRALAYAIDLGADAEFITTLAEEINDYWVMPMDETRLQNTLINPALRRL